MTEVVALQRHKFNDVVINDRFVLQEKLYNKQFNHMYTCRLNLMKPHLSRVALDKWGTNTRIFSPLIEVESYFVENPDATLPIVLIGNVFKDLSLRPSALTEEKESDELNEPVGDLKKCFFSSSDRLFLEDESGRIELISNGDWLPNLVTGVTIAVLGLPNEYGQFEVSEYCSAFPTFSESVSPSEEMKNTSDDEFVLLLSGLEFGSTLVTSSGEGGGIDDVTSLELSAQMLSDFVSGRLGGEEHVRLASKIGRVIIAGNSINSTSKSLAKARTTTQKNQHEIKSFSKQLDFFLFQMLGSCDVDLMPGVLDPTNNSMPQQPLNACFTPQSSRFSSYHPVTNPYESSVELREGGGKIQLMGHSGSPVEDISRQVPHRSPVEIMCDTLKWGNICPTAPDTLPSYPYQDTDPFVISPSHLPNIYFAGNQDVFDSRLVISSSGHRTRVISIPKFSTTREVSNTLSSVSTGVEFYDFFREAVLVNMSTLSCEVLRFGV